MKGWWSQIISAYVAQYFLKKMYSFSFMDKAIEIKPQMMGIKETKLLRWCYTNQFEQTL